MHIYLTEHCKEQIKKRDPNKSIKKIVDIFKQILDCYCNKKTYEGNKVNKYDAKSTYQTDNYKLICGKYGFIYNKQGPFFYLPFLFLFLS